MALNLININNMLDDLYLELMTLVEQQTACRVNIERSTNAGQLLLAKTRYNQGSQAINVAHIPTENCEEFKALTLVTEQPNDKSVSGGRKSLLSHKIEKEEGYLDPLHWFTVLPPMSLRNAAKQYKNSLDYIIESANIQTEMVAIMKSINHLKSLKQKF